MLTQLVSVIVPTFNSGAYLDDCLRSIVNQSYRRIELIVVDNNSTDDTKTVARNYTDKVYNKGPERSAQRNFGVKQSQGDFVLIIDSDMNLSKNVVLSCLEKVQENKDYRAIVIPEESFGEGFWAHCKKLERSRYVGVHWMEAARFFFRVVFDEMDGYDERLDGGEDYDLAQRVEYKYGRRSIGRITDYIFHNERRLSLLTSCRKKYYYAKKISLYRKHPANKMNFGMQASVFQRYALLMSHPSKLWEKPIVGAGMLFMKTCELLSAALGYATGRLCHHRMSLANQKEKPND